MKEEKKIQRYQIDYYEDRQNIIRGFANSGYAVWAEEEVNHDYPSEESPNRITFYICVMEKPVKQLTA